MAGYAKKKEMENVCQNLISSKRDKQFTDSK